MIVVIEGGDAAGKQTQSTKLAEKLRGTRFTFPNYESRTGQAILGHLKKKWAVYEIISEAELVAAIDSRRAESTLLDAMVFQCLQTANRLELLPDIKTALGKGPVVFDRYWQSAYVYGSLDGLDKDWLRRVQEAPMPSADVNILIDVPVAAGFERRPERRDRYESNREFMEKVRRAYLELWDAGHVVYDPHKPLPAQIGKYRDVYQGVCYVHRDWIVVDGIGTVDEVHERIWSIVKEV